MISRYPEHTYIVVNLYEHIERMNPERNVRTIYVTSGKKAEDARVRQWHDQVDQIVES